METQRKPFSMKKKQYMRMSSRNDRHCGKLCEAGHVKRISDVNDG
ncbi:hypothetical protein SOASR015_31960 [Pectobacterium carotovorum subsp. carotovorum]|nr:hypothetical protein SOASR015_31960 [Pectobacterium carotovorum subsp. carotovorum]GLX58012.1 hypothetical protein Pcaca02_33210 [Pectobacterium carotovorum subsp. carotovorum]